MATASHLPAQHVLFMQNRIEVLPGLREPTLPVWLLAMLFQEGCATLNPKPCMSMSAASHMPAWRACRPLSGNRHGELLHAAVEICAKIMAGGLVGFNVGPCRPLASSKLCQVSLPWPSPRLLNSAWHLEVPEVP